VFLVFFALDASAHRVLDSFQTAAWLVGAAVFLIYLLVTGGRAFWRIVFEIDPAGPTVTVRRGLVWPLFESRHAAAGFSAVAVTPFVRRGPRGRAEVTYLLELRGPAGPVRLAREHDSRTARYLAEDVGWRLRLDVIDATENPPVVRKAETLGQTLREAARREEPAARRAADYPPPHPDLNLDYELTADRAVFRFPAKGYGCLAAWLPVAAAGVAAGVSYVTYVGGQSGNAGLIALWTAIWSLVIGVPLLFGFWAAAPTKVTVEADRRSIRVTTTTFGVPRRREIATDRVRAIRRTFRHLEVEAREGAAGFGCGGLTEEQVEWVRAVLIRVVTA
jgi:hypothetical protein